MAFKWDEPMNPYATEDFKNAMKKAGEDLSKGFKGLSEDLKRIGEQMKVNVDEGVMSFIDFDDMPTEYSGVMRLKADADKDISNILNALLYNGYEVTMRLEDATETEKEMDGTSTFVVIEFGEVE